MAKIHEEKYIVYLNQLIKNSTQDVAPIANKDFAENLETIIQELVGDNIVVEVEKDE